MNRSPDWITGGDPIQTHWLDGRDLLQGKELRWHLSGEWADGTDSIAIETGYAADGTVVALRAQARIGATARKLFAEAGWFISANSVPEIPVLAPRIWQESWLSFLHGEINLQTLGENLGGGAGDRGTMNFPAFRPSMHKPYPGRKTSGLSVALALLAAAALGFLSGWFARAKFYETNHTPAPALQEHGRREPSPEPP